MLKVNLFLKYQAHCGSLSKYILMTLSVCFSFTYKGISQVKINSDDHNNLMVVNEIGKNKVASVKQNRTTKKGTFSFYWGYTRAGYSKSDIHFSGKGYNFSIVGVEAHDEQIPISEIGNVYINPGKITWPQYCYNLGYFITDHTYISVGQDHMKYRIIKQTTLLTGYVNNDNNNGGNIGIYNNTEVLVGENGYNHLQILPGENLLKQGFVTNFENCDGLNDIFVNIGRTENLWMAKNGKQHMDATTAVGAGMEVVDTDAEILGYPSNHNNGSNKSYHIAGYSCSAVIGLEFYLFTNFFLQTRLKGGYINLPDINTTLDGGKASQHFWFNEYMVVAGYSFFI